MDNRYRDLALGGVITFSTIVTTDAMIIDGITFLCQDTAPTITDQEFASGASDSDAATNLAAAINHASAQALFDAVNTRVIRNSDNQDETQVLSKVTAIANAGTVELYRSFIAAAPQVAIVFSTADSTITYSGKNSVPSAAAQTFLEAGARSYLRIQNLGADSVHVNFGRAANTANGLKILGGGVLELKEAVPHNYVSMIASATTRDVAIIVG